jgi:hypothetical protein
MVFKRKNHPASKKLPEVFWQAQKSHRDWWLMADG